MYALARSINRQMAAAGNSLSSGHSKTQQWERVADVAQIMGRGESEAAGNVIVIQAGKRKRKSKSKKKKKKEATDGASLDSRCSDGRLSVVVSKARERKSTTNIKIKRLA